MREQSELIKELRIERNITQEVLAQGITTREAVSNFERRGTNITSNTLLTFLDRMNVTLEEYGFLLNNKNLTKKQEMFIEGVNYHNKVMQEDYLNRLNETYKSTNDYAYALIASQYRLLYAFKNNTNKMDDLIQDKQKIQNHLNNVQNWGRFELSLFTNVLFVFNTEYIYSTYRRVIKNMKLYSNHPHYKDNIGIFIKNCLILFWKRAKYTHMNLLLSELDVLTKNIGYSSERFTYLIFQKVVTYKEQFTVSMIDPEIEILRFLGYHDYAKQIVQYFSSQE